uniref:Uncharacterized protein n=1 Tax=Cucumis melo TaxID=3656 RepID=A0A9I9CIZ2_CUCME
MVLPPPPAYGIPPPSTPALSLHCLRQYPVGNLTTISVQSSDPINIVHSTSSRASSISFSL